MGHFGPRCVYAPTRKHQRCGGGPLSLCKPAAHALKQGLQVTQLVCELALGALAQRLCGALMLALNQALDEQSGVFDHANALGVRCALVVLEPGVELPGGQGVGVQTGQQCAGVLAVGARQRRQNARGRPARDARTAHRLHQLLGQRAQQHQAALHPAHVARALQCGLALRESMRVDEFAQQQRLLYGIKYTRQRIRQHLSQRSPHRAVPALHQCSVHP